MRIKLTVCHGWYELIPQHGTDFWEELESSKRSWAQFNNALSIVSFQKVHKISQQLKG